MVRYDRAITVFSPDDHLFQVVESGGKNIEIATMTHMHGLCQLEEAEISKYVAKIEAEKAAAEAAKKGVPKET